MTPETAAAMERVRRVNAGDDVADVYAEMLKYHGYEGLDTVAYSMCDSDRALLARLFIAERDETNAKHRKRCEQECTRDVIFLFQRKVLNLHGLPDGLDCQEGCVTIKNEEEFADEVVIECLDEKLLEQMRGDGLPLREFMKLGLEYGELCHQCVQETWLTESVWIDREEAERYGKAKEYNYVDGWRVYGVCATGDLAKLIRGESPITNPAGGV